MKSSLLEIDIGASACKATVFDEYGQVAASTARPYEDFCPRDGWVEQNSNQWRAAVVDAITGLIRKDGINPAHIKGVGIDGQSWSAIPIDKNGDVLANAMIWMDTRSGEIFGRLKNEVGEDEIFALRGNPV